MRSLAVATVLAIGASACGRIGYDTAVDASPDVSSDIAADAISDGLIDGQDAPPVDVPSIDVVDVTDAGPDALPTNCSIWNGGFVLTTPEPISELNGPSNDTAPVFVGTSDLQMTFTSDRSGGTGSEDLYVANRATASSAFNAPMLMTDLDSPDRDERAVVSRDLMRAYFSSNRPAGMGGLDVWTANRLGASGMFRSPIVLTGIDTADDEFDFMLTLDGTEAFFARSTGAGIARRTHIYASTLQPDGVTLGTAAAVVEINSTFDEAGPSLTENQLAIVFSSNRGTVGGTHDLYLSIRASTGSPFGPPMILPIVNTSSNEITPFVSRDGCDLYFASDRPSGAGGYDLYHARFVPM